MTNSKTERLEKMSNAVVAICEALAKEDLTFTEAARVILVSSDVVVKSYEIAKAECQAKKLGITEIEGVNEHGKAG